MVCFGNGYLYFNKGNPNKLNFVKKIFLNWNLVRFIRLLLGLGIFIQGVFDKDLLRIIIGFLFFGMAIVNVGCCGSNGCSIKTK